jgi:hypothetical protein
MKNEDGPERITTLGTAAAAFASLLVLVSLPQPLAEWTRGAAENLAVAIPLCIVPVFAAMVPSDAQRIWRIIGRVLELGSFIVGQLFFVMAVYSLFRYVYNPAANTFVQVAGGAYLITAAVYWFSVTTRQRTSD